jgi:hypothetical protein
MTDAHTELLFSYGTLQLEPVQMATFGRPVVGTRDVLVGFEVLPLQIEDASVVALSGKTVHNMVTFTGCASDIIPGVVFALTPEELQSADKYEVPAVRRVAVILQSGVRAWVYVDSRNAPADGWQA